MWTHPQEAADLITFTEEILNGKLHFLFQCQIDRGHFLRLSSWTKMIAEAQLFFTVASQSPYYSWYQLDLEETATGAVP